MARPPRRPAAPAKKAAAPRRRGAVEGVQVETLLNNATVKVIRTTMQPGAEIPQQERGLDYLIFPVTELGYSRRFTRNGRITREVALTGTPGKPSFVRATRPGAEFSVHNTSGGVIVFDKIVIKGPKA
jgi:hypothetical protein